MARPTPEMADDVRSFCAECFGKEGPEAVCKKLMDGKPCSLYEWWTNNRGQLRKAIHEQCEYCLSGQHKSTTCTSPKCRLFKYDREE